MPAVLPRSAAAHGAVRRYAAPHAEISRRRRSPRDSARAPDARSGRMLRLRDPLERVHLKVRRRLPLPGGASREHCTVWPVGAMAEQVSDVGRDQGRRPCQASSIRFTSSPLLTSTSLRVPKRTDRSRCLSPAAPLRAPPGSACRALATRSMSRTFRANRFGGTRSRAAPRTPPSP